MSRDQKPGRFKLVGGTAPNPGRRRDDKLLQQAQGPAGSAQIAAQTGADATPRFRSLLLALLFLLACGGGGAGAVALGLVEGLPG